MTFPRIKATGSGSLAWRLSIESLDVDFVSNAAMAGAAADGRTRAVGLKASSLKIEQRADLPRATIEASGVTFQIADVGEAATAAFNTSPTATTWVAAETSSTATSVQVKSTASFAASGRAWIDSETIAYTALGTSGGSPALLGLTRGVWQTLAQTHYVPGGAFLRFPAVTDRPTTLVGRRVRLYAYGAGDSLTGDGTQVWLGVVRTEPRMQGATWSIGCDPISSVLEQTIGADLGEPVTPRGIYLPAPGVWWGFGLGTTGAVPIGDTSHIIKAQGFFETQAAFIAHVQSLLDAMVTSWGAGKPNVYIVGSPDGTYHFEIQQGATAYGVEVRSYSEIGCEPFFESGTVTNSADGPGALVPLQLANTRYYAWPVRYPLPDSGQVPRGIFGASSSPPSPDADLAAAPANRLYLGGAVAVTTNTNQATIEWTSSTGSDERSYALFSRDASTRSIDLERSATDPTLERRVYTPSTLPTIRLGRYYGAPGYPGIASLLRALTVNSADQINTGAQPVIRTGDVNLSAIIEAYEGAPAFATSRYYASTDAVKLIDLIAPDLQLAGLYLAFDSDGALTVQRLRLPSPTEVGVYAITRSNLVTKELPSYERAAIGTFTAALVRDGYSFTTKKWRTTHVVRDVTAAGAAPGQMTLPIEPRSMSSTEIGTADVVALANAVIGIYGYPYAYVHTAVPLDAWEVLIGDAVTISTNLLPSGAGTRGMTDTVGLITSRVIQPTQGRIDLTILVTPRRIAGYAPSALIASQTGADDLWTVTLSSSYFVSGETAEDHFTGGDRVEVYRFDSLTAGTLAGEVLSVSGYDVTVQFDAVWAPSTDEWVLTYAPSDDGAIQSGQRRYAYLAAADGIVDFEPDPDADAFTLAP